MKTNAIIARRYAHAFINIFGNELPTSTLQNIGCVLNVIAQRNIVSLALRGPTFTEEQRKAVLDSLFDHCELSEHFKKLGQLLIKDRRVFLAPKVLFYVKQLYARSKRITPCTIKSSHPLHENQLALLVKCAEAHTGDKILYNVQHDPTLIAGIRLQGETFFWEHSVKRQLQRLKEPLMSRGFYEQH